MLSLLLVIIYIAFISLGLPDSLLGSAWPVIYTQFSVPISYAGLVTMIIACGTIISSLLSNRLTTKFGAGLVTAVSVMLTALALFGFSVSNKFFMLCLWAIPYGLGAGAVDAALNNYVAIHYASRHMSWLHCFWGVGASISPYIMGFFLTRGYGWDNGFLSIAIIQIVLTILLFVSLPLWKRKKVITNEERKDEKNLTLSKALKIRGVKLALFAFFAYCGLETTTGLWASSYLVKFRGIDPKIAANFASLFYLGITFGRFINGFIADKVKGRHLIRSGIIIILLGIIFMGIPLKNNILGFAGLVIIGLGCAPIYPSIIHSTPYIFGKQNSQAIIGLQMAGAYVGSTFIPPLFGVIADKLSIGLYPLFIGLFVILLLVMSEILNKKVSRNQQLSL